jgi:ethanolamine utilization microcompartment shell protein EutS
LQDSDTVDLVVEPVNDAPVNTVPGQQTVNEDASLTFSTAQGNAISVADVDANEGTGQVKVTLAVGNGGLTLGSTAGLSGVTGDGTGTVMLTGSLAAVNAALQGLVYAPDAEFNGNDALIVTTDDLGNTGDPGPRQDVSVVGLTVNPVNDAPVNTVPLSTQVLDEDSSLVFSSANGNALSVADPDVDEGTGQVQVTLGVGDGGLTLGSTAGLSSFTGNGSSTVVLSGTLAAVNAALEGLVYAPDADFFGPDTLTVTTNDLGNTGAPGALEDIDTVSLQVDPINDAPVNLVPTPQHVNEDTDLTFSAANGNALSVSDDSGASPIQVQLGVGEGTLTLGSTAGVLVTGDGTGAVTVLGSVAAINAALEGLVYTPGAEFSGPDTLTISTDDLGNTGVGGPMQDFDSVAITVIPFNDAPVHTVPGPQMLDEDTALVFSMANGNLISVDDVDSGAGSLESTIEVQHGTLTVITVDGTIISAPRIIIVEDDLAKLNAALDGLTYTPDPDYFGDDLLTITTTDRTPTTSATTCSPSPPPTRATPVSAARCRTWTRSPSRSIPSTTPPSTPCPPPRRWTRTRC